MTETTLDSCAAGASVFAPPEPSLQPDIIIAAITNDAELDHGREHLPASEVTDRRPS
jgi:hypothetical protein